MAQSQSAEAAPWPSARELRRVDIRAGRLDDVEMNVSVPSCLQEFIEHKVATGEFQSADEVVCEGLKLLQKQEEWKSELRTKIEERWEQVQRGEAVSAEESLRRLRDLSEAERRLSERLLDCEGLRVCRGGRRILSSIDRGPGAND